MNQKSKPPLTLITPLNLPWNWSADYQQQTCLELAKKHHVIVYLANDGRFFLKPSRLSWQPPRLRNITFIEPLFFLPGHRFAFIERLNHLLNIFFLSCSYSVTTQVILWIFDPRFAFYLPAAWFAKTMYDCVDYHRGLFTGLDQKQVDDQEQFLFQHATLATVNSQTLHQLHVGKRSNLPIVPQGFRWHEFASSNLQLTPRTMTKTSRFGSKPVLGFIGALNNRLDFELLLPLIKRHPEYTFVFWGPQASIHSSKLKQLLKFKNVITGQSDDRSELAAIIQEFDIALIPYDVSKPFNRYSYPMKVFEYFYLGKPVLATSIDELKKLAPWVVTADTLQNWESHIKSLLAKSWPARYKQAQRQLAWQNRWSAKIKAMLNLLDRSSQLK